MTYDRNYALTKEFEEQVTIAFLQAAMKLPQRSAMLYLLLGTCKLPALNPEVLFSEFLNYYHPGGLIK